MACDFMVLGDQVFDIHGVKDHLTSVIWDGDEASLLHSSTEPLLQQGRSHPGRIASPLTCSSGVKPSKFVVLA